MKFVLNPSLEHMTLVKIVISLWNQNDVSALISKLSYGDLFDDEKWDTIEKRVMDKVPQLSLPQLLKEKMFGVIKPIGIQIRKWMKYYRQYDLWIKFEYDLNSDLPVHLPADLCWTPQGTVDRKRTAEVLVRNDNLNVSRCYRLACDYFLENDIIRFWNRLPENIKEYDWDKFPVVSFWSDNMKRGEASHISYKDVFYSSVRDCNKVAAKYFLQKLTPQEREQCLKGLAIRLIDADVLCFLLPEMDEEEKIKVLKSYPYGVLQCFLEWPWQSFFIGVANCMWDFISQDDYDEILGDILTKVENGYKDYNYQEVFRELWQKSPYSLKISFIEKISNNLVTLLFIIKDKENIRLILNDATLTVKKKLIYSDKIYDYLICSINDNEWDFLEFFIRECLPSKKEMLKFKEEFKKRRCFKYFSAIEKQKWNRMLCSSDDYSCKSDKRSVEEGESSSSKRFQSRQT